MKVLVFATLRFPPENIERLRPHLQALVDATRRHDGCIAYDVAEDVFDPGLLRLSEVWPDAAALEAHLHAPHIAPWRAAATELGLTDRTFVSYEAQEPASV
jgi:quinol monooxygenase YgiN